MSAMVDIIKADPKQEIFCAQRYYSFPFNKLYLQRFKILLKLLGKGKRQNLLDIGFGSGIFLPALSLKTEHLFGTDNHPYANEVAKMIANAGIKAELKNSSVTSLPYADNQFDCVTCLSVLEFVVDTDKAMAEISRVTKPGAKIIIGAPVVGKMTDLAYKIIGKKGQNAVYHKSDHKKIIASAGKYFKIEKIKTLPPFFPLDFSLFFFLSAKNKK